MKVDDPIVPGASQLRGLCDRYGLSEGQREQLAAILRVLASDERAPTAVRDPARAAEVHLADSLVALELEVWGSVRRIADLGAGAGFPGLALAVALPGSEVRLVEAQERKCAFARDLCVRAGIANVRVLCARAEEWVEGLGSHEAVLARALAPPAVVVEYAAPLLVVGGFLVDWRGRRDRWAERSGASAAARLGLELVEIRHMEPYVGSRDHHLHLYAKLRATPEGFPRRAGMARKRPLA